MANRHELSQPRPLPNPGWGPLAALPGNPLMWVLILSEIVVFAAFFGLFARRRGEVAVVIGELPNQSSSDTLAPPNSRLRGSSIARSFSRRLIPTPLRPMVQARQAVKKP